MDANPEKVEDVRKAREFIERMSFETQALPPVELDDLLGKIIANEQPPYRSVVRKKNSNAWADKQWLKVAAILVLAMMGAVIINEIVSEIPKEPAPRVVEWRTIENPKGRKSKVTLPDGSQIDLNYESSLRFPKTFEGGVRKVELIGEAFFDVVPNDTMPFIVQIGDLETEVLGTSFNIQYYEGESETNISLVTGKVRVNKKKNGSGSEARVLIPGEQLNYHRNSQEIFVRAFDLDQVTAWKEGVIIFKDAGLEEFIDQLEKWYGVNFQIYGSSSKQWKINGRYQDEKLDDILIGLKFVYDIEYKIQGKNVILKLK